MLTRQRYLVAGVRRAPRWFALALKRINRHLEIRWNDKRHRWVIYERTRRGEFKPVRVLEDEVTGEYVPLDTRTLKSIRDGDTWRKIYGVQSVLDEIQAHNEAREEEERKKMKDACFDAAVHICRKGSDLKTFDLGRDHGR